MRTWDNQTLQPATLFLSICFGLDLLYLLLFSVIPDIHAFALCRGFDNQPCSSESASRSTCCICGSYTEVADAKKTMETTVLA